MKNSKLLIRGAIHSLLVAVYVFLVAIFMINVSSIFPKAEDNFLAPLFMILLFVLSAFVTGSLVLAKPIMLYLDGHKKDSIKLLFFTGLALFGYLLVVFLFLMLR